MRIFFIMLVFLAVACNGDDERVFDGGLGEQKPASKASGNLKKLSSNTRKRVAQATYALKIRTKSGASLCSGEATIDILSDLSMNFPNAFINCLALRIDLASLLKQTGSEIRATATSDGDLLYVDAMGPARFEPPRPILVGPIVQDARKYRGFEKSTQHSVTVDPQSGGGSGRGTIGVKVLGVDEEYSNSHIDKPFERILRWEMTAKGFAGAPLASTFLFEKIEFYWNVRPIMIPKFVIRGRVSDFIQGGSKGNAGVIGSITDAVFGVLTIEFNVTEYDFE